MGDEQPLVGNQQRRRELASQTWWAMGWAAVGLDQCDDQVRSPDGCLLFCNGLGRGAASGTQRVLNAHPTKFYTPPAPFFPRLLQHFSPPFLRNVPVDRHLRFCSANVGEPWSERDKAAECVVPSPLPFTRVTDRDINSSLSLISYGGGGGGVDWGVYVYFAVSTLFNYNLYILIWVLMRHDYDMIDEFAIACIPGSSSMQNVKLSLLSDPGPPRVPLCFDTIATILVDPPPDVPVLLLPLPLHDK